MKDNYLSFAVQARRVKVPELIRYFYIRALMCEVTLEVAPMSPWAREKMRDELYRRVATLMTLDWYSATHPFDKEDVEIEPCYLDTDKITHWWRRYHHCSPDQLVDKIWAEVDL
jgi:hypothetical protein